MKKSELKKQLEQAKSEIRELVLRPNSEESRSIVKSITLSCYVEGDNNLNNAKPIANVISMSLPDCMDILSKVQTLPQ